MIQGFLLITSTEDVFSIVAMVMDGGGWCTVALATPQQSGSTPLLVKYPYLQGICSYLDDLCVGKDLFWGSGQTEQVFLFLQPLCYLDGVVCSVSDQERLCVQEGCPSHRRAVGVSMLSDHLAALQIPECNVALRTAGCQDGRTV